MIYKHLIDVNYNITWIFALELLICALANIWEFDFPLDVIPSVGFKPISFNVVLGSMIIRFILVPVCVVEIWPIHPFPHISPWSYSSGSPVASNPESLTSCQAEYLDILIGSLKKNQVELNKCSIRNFPPF